VSSGLVHAGPFVFLTRNVTTVVRRRVVRALFRYALVTTDGDALGTVAFARSDLRPGDVIPHGPERSLRVVNVIEPERDDQLPVLVVEPAGRRLSLKRLWKRPAAPPLVRLLRPRRRLRGYVVSSRTAIPGISVSHAFRCMARCGARRSTLKDPSGLTSIVVEPVG